MQVGFCSLRLSGKHQMCSCKLDILWMQAEILCCCFSPEPHSFLWRQCSSPFSGKGFISLLFTLTRICESNRFILVLFFILLLVFLSVLLPHWALELFYSPQKCTCIVVCTIIHLCIPVCIFYYTNLVHAFSLWL